MIKGLGVGYLFYWSLGWVFQSGAAAFCGEENERTVEAAFRQGVMVDPLNPQSALFFKAFLPQFTVPSIGCIPFQLVVPRVRPTLRQRL